jgi:hypothetical protein
MNAASKRAPHDFEGRGYHCISTTYGAWLYGDARGFRTRHHREHVEGDYKNRPPAGANSQKRMASVESLKQAALVIPPEWRQSIGESIRDKLFEKGVFVLCVAVCGQHVHLLAKFPRGTRPRLQMGLARKNSTFKAHERGWQGRLWGRRGKELKVKDRRHQLNIRRYIFAHRSEGAWIWDWMNESDRAQLEGSLKAQRAVIERATHAREQKQHKCREQSRGRGEHS